MDTSLNRRIEFPSARVSRWSDGAASLWTYQWAGAPGMVGLLRRGCTRYKIIQSPRILRWGALELQSGKLVALFTEVTAAPRLQLHTAPYCCRSDQRLVSFQPLKAVSR